MPRVVRTSREARLQHTDFARRWTADDDALIEEKRAAKWTRPQIAAYLGRTVEALDSHTWAAAKRRGDHVKRQCKYNPPVLDQNHTPSIPEGDPLLMALRAQHGRDAPRDVETSRRAPINATLAGVVRLPLQSSALGDA